MKAVLLNSGGIDSLVAGKQMLLDHADTDWEFVSLHVRNQRGPEWENAAWETANLLGMKHETVRIEYMWDWWRENKNGTWINPAGNIGVHFIAYQWCLANGATVLYSGLKPDNNSQEWMAKLKDTLYSTAAVVNNPNHQRPLIHFPLEGWNTSMDEVVQRANELGLPLDHTLSCNRVPADGTCARCRDRSRLGLQVQ